MIKGAERVTVLHSFYVSAPGRDLPFLPLYPTSAPQCSSHVLPQLTSASAAGRDLPFLPLYSPSAPQGFRRRTRLALPSAFLPFCPSSFHHCSLLPHLMDFQHPQTQQLSFLLLKPCSCDFKPSGSVVSLLQSDTPGSLHLSSLPDPFLEAPVLDSPALPPSLS